MATVASSGIEQRQTESGDVAVQDNGENVAKIFRSGQSQILGLTLLVIGVLMFIATIISYVAGGHGRSSPNSFAGPCGVLFVCSGLSGLRASTRLSKHISCFMLCTIISGSVAAYVFYSNSTACSHKQCSDGRVSALIVISLMAVVGAVASVWGAAISCKAFCCEENATDNDAVAGAPCGENQELLVCQQPETVLDSNQEVVANATFPPSNQPVPGGYSPTQQQYVVPGPDEKQYGHNIPAAPPPDASSSNGGTRDVAPPPSYDECFGFSSKE